MNVYNLRIQRTQSTVHAVVTRSFFSYSGKGPPLSIKQESADFERALFLRPRACRFADVVGLPVLVCKAQFQTA